MISKRALMVLIALLLFPALAAAQIDAPEPPPITPAEGTANIVVYKIFADGNDEDTATVTLSCTSGTIANASAELGHEEGKIFVIDNLPEAGPDVVCTVTESDLTGYSPTYQCHPAYAGGDPTCTHPEFNLTTECKFNDVNAYEGNGTNDSVGYCYIENSPAPVDVDVHKVWEMAGNAQADVNQDVRITLICDGEIVGGTEAGNLWWTQQDLTIGGGDFDDEEGDYTGMGTATFEVIPDFYSTAADPKLQEYTTCYTKESLKDSYVELDNGCGDSFEDATIEVAAGMGDECTMTNTVFFEGIPTLNQYGMAIMALLMLGVGFVGFRRFV